MSLVEPLALALDQSAIVRDQAIVRAGRTLLKVLEAGKAIDARTLRTAMEEAFGASDSDGAWVWKDAYEAAECAQVLFLQKFGALMQRQAKTPPAFLTMIERLVRLVPSHTRRSEDAEKLQQFSTPLPLAYVAAHAAGLRPSDIVLEPSAGTGMLAVFAQIAGASLVLNEYAETRAEILARLFETPAVTRHDAATINDRLDPQIEPSVVLINPPFSAAPNVQGRFKAATAQHVRSALARLRPNGRLVLISGSNFAPDNRHWRDFFEALNLRASVSFTAPIAGNVYARHGTTTETRLTVIDKLPKRQAADLRHVPMVQSTDELLGRVLDLCPPRPEIAAAAAIPVARAIPSVVMLREQARAEARAKAAERAKHPLDAAEAAEIAYCARQRADKEATISATSLYEPYSVDSIDIADAKPHPTALVQSAAMASVTPPLPSYRPTLPSALTSDGILSEAQIESVIYAGEAHSGHLKGMYTVDETYDRLMAAADGNPDAFRIRRGFFLGDGTGCGKGRQVAGIIMDNWLKGRRRAIWLSKSDKLIEDAVRDWTALGGAKSDIVPLSRFRQGSDIKLDQGILFVTYATLRTAARQDKTSRLDQIIEWLGRDFDGVIAFDEAHAMANAAGHKGERGEKKPSQQGLAGLRLQNALPEARVLYVSATGATVVSNLAYASRLGLWDTGDFPFKSRAEFVASMEAGGIAAMEVISRDLKALGLYIARSISFEGVEYEMLVHELTPAQREIYDAYAGAFQIIHQHLEAAMAASGITSEEGTLNPQAKSAARSAFESNKQRFFNHLITAMKCPSLINAIAADLAAGHSAVVQVVSTSEALLERRLSEIPVSEWNDLQIDITPREYVLDYLMHSFPTQLFEPYTDEEGNLQSRPALDADGNPIICREAVEARDSLVEHLCALPPVQGALDQLLWHFGKDQVAEVTGRSRRIIRTSDGRLKVERRPASANLGETSAFMNDDKRILIFSDAGGTGRSYHAELAAKNQRLRVHYLLEPGWRADNAIQGLGRTHRTNQAQPPLFRPCATDVKGEKRFLSTIARRLDTLGAITKGQRQTGGQNMFRAEDNLESTYARAALRRFFANLHVGRIEACSLETFQEMTGLSLCDRDGTLREELPPISQFLNRCLALTIAMQNAIFESFSSILEGIVEEAIAAGTYDVGLETLQAERFTIADRRTIYEHGPGGASTEALTIERLTRNRPLTLDGACSRCASDPKATLLLNGKSGRAAITVPTTSLMTDEGEPLQRVELIRPMASEKMLELELASTQWKLASDTDFARAWEQEVADVPEFSTSRITLVSGLLLPIWDRLPSENMRVYRLQAATGERVVGRLVTQAQLAGVFASLGLDCTIEMTAQEVREAVIERRATIHLAGGISLRRARVMEGERIEVLGFQPSDLPRMKAMGCYTEIITWKTRLFVPTNDVSVLETLLGQTKIVATPEAA
jgi:hypothetical protein